MDSNWVVGFTEGEGCFNNKGGYQIIKGFQITQHNRDALLIKSFITFFFDCGRVESYYQGPAVNFVVSKLSDIT